jgi:aspartate aminotransferase
MLVVQNAALDHEYLPIDGLPAFTAASAKLILGEGSKAILQGRVTGCQSISGTGAVRIGADLLARFHPGATVYITNPTWANHRAIFEAAGIRVAEIPYWDAASKGLAFQAHLATLQVRGAVATSLAPALYSCPTDLGPSHPSPTDRLRPRAPSS